MGKKERLYRVVTFLKRDELDFLDDLVKDIYFTYGKKVPRAKLIEEVIATFKDKGIGSKQELIAKILVSVRRKIERRKYPRLKKDLLVAFRKVESLQEHKTGISENVSLGGLKIDMPALDEPLSVNQVIELTIKSPEEDLEPIKAIGRVAWIKAKENKQGFEIGVMLTYIRKEDKERFAKYLIKEEKIKLIGGN